MLHSLRRIDERMLSYLKIRNLALVERLNWELGAGLVGVTGETGAGKSVIVGALKLVLGERAAKGLIRTGEKQCEVEAVFEVPDPAAVDRILEEGGFEACEDGQLIIKRVVSLSGSRQFVNNSPATLGLLKGARVTFGGFARAARSSVVVVDGAAVGDVGCFCGSEWRGGCVYGGLAGVAGEVGGV